MRVLCSAVLLMMLGSAAADPPATTTAKSSFPLMTAEMNGPDNIAAGKSAIIKVDRTLAGNEFDWQVQPSGVNWISGENRQETFVILLDLDPGRYFISFTSYDKKSHATHVVEVDHSSPPDPAPVPPIPPGPAPLPDGKYKLAAQSRDWVSTVAAEHRQAATPLGNSFRGIAAAIAAGTLTKPADILAQTRSSNNAALGTSIEAWKRWGQQLQAVLERLDHDGTLRTPDDYKTAWEEIAAGLEASLPSPTK